MGKTTFVDLTGKRFGLLDVLARVPDPPGYRSRRWKCRCDCGTVKVIFGQAIVRGDTKSCGCQRTPKGELASAFVHGLANTREYAIWSGIITRCTNPNRKCYHLYGGRGITICDRWTNGDGVKSGFECFLADVGPCPSRKHSIDRFPDQDGNYEPTNVRWATMIQQANNRRNTRLVTFRGIEMPLTEAVRISGCPLHYETVWTRIKLCGWPVERALTEALQECK